MHRSNLLLFAFVTVQVLCASVFVSDLATTVLGTRTTPLSWQTREALELAASLGLVLGAVFGVRAIFDMRRRSKQAENTIRSLSGALTEVLEEHFSQWDLTPAEREVAWLTIKGFTIAEIAELRGTRDGTIKAQSTAIYRKAGVKSRAQLLALVVEDIIGSIGPQSDA